MYQAGYAVGQLIAFLLFLTPAVFFLLTQQNTLKAIRRENRRLRPGLVWLQLIPIFNFCWMFVVVTRVADSLYKENASLMDDSILGVPDPDAAGSFGKRPTYRIGMAYCIQYLLLFFALIIFFNLFGRAEDARGFAIISLILCLSVITCWIIYWVKLAGEKRKLQYLRV